MRDRYGHFSVVLGDVHHRGREIHQHRCFLVLPGHESKYLCTSFVLLRRHLAGLVPEYALPSTSKIGSLGKSLPWPAASRLQSVFRMRWTNTSVWSARCAMHVVSSTGKSSKGALSERSAVRLSMRAARRNGCSPRLCLRELRSQRSAVGRERFRSQRVVSTANPETMSA